MRILPEIRNKTKWYPLTALICFCSFYMSYAQVASSNANTFASTIKGIVADSATQVALSHVTVAVQEVGKNKASKNTLTNEDGFFEITGLSPQKQYLLTLTYTGYKATTIQLPSITSPTLHLGQITLVSLAKQLREVQVTTQKPLMEQDLDKLTYNVESDPESKTASALDILRKIPLVTIDADDNLLLNGNNTYRVLINGKSSSLFLRNPSEVLQTLSASAIKTIEIFTVPPSKYEASGVGGIINITTYKKHIGGYSGGLNIRGSSPKALSTTGHISHKKGKLGFSGNFGYNYNTNPANNSTNNRVDKIRLNRLEQIGSSTSESHANNASAEINYELNSQNFISASYSMNNGNSNSDFSQRVTLFNTLGDRAEAYHRLNTGRNEHEGQDFGLEYLHSSKKNDAQQLTISYRWISSTYNNITDFTLLPLVNYKDQASITSNEDHFSEQRLQLDYVQPIKKHTLELGAHSIFNQNNSDYFYKNLDTTIGAFVLDSTQSDKFNYQEDIYAAYASLHLKMGKWGLKTGTRLEVAKVDAHFISSSTIANQEYRNLIPNITLSKQLKGNSVFNLSYTQRIQRPDLSHLNPYVDLTDPYNISYGNPALQPALAHMFNLAYNTFIKKTSISINATHQFTNNAIQQFTTLGADTIARTTFGNIGKNQNSSFSLGSHTTLFKKLSINVNGNANYMQYTTSINGKPHTNKGLTYSASGSLNLRLKSWRVVTNVGYNAPNILAQGKSASYVSNSITVNKYFFKNNKANLGLSVTSPFQEHRRSFSEISDPTFHQVRESHSVIRRYSLSFNYRFGKVQ